MPLREGNDNLYKLIVSDNMMLEVDGGELAEADLRPNKTCSRAQLMEEFWGVVSETSLRVVDVYITNCGTSSLLSTKDLRPKPSKGWATRWCCKIYLVNFFINV